MKNLVPQANCPFGPTPAFNSCSKIFVFHYSSFFPHIYCKGLPLWVPAFELDWPILSKSEPCQQKLETPENYMWSLLYMTFFNTTYFLPLCSPLSDEHRELWEQCMCSEQQQNMRRACWVIKLLFFLIEYALSYPHQIHTHCCMDEWLKGTHCWPISLSYHLFWGKEFSPKLRCAILLFFFRCYFLENNLQ